MLGLSEEGSRHRLRVTLLQEFFPDQFFLEIASASNKYPKLTSVELQALQRPLARAIFFFDRQNRKQRIEWCIFLGSNVPKKRIRIRIGEPSFYHWRPTSELWHRRAPRLSKKKIARASGRWSAGSYLSWLAHARVRGRGAPIRP